MVEINREQVIKWRQEWLDQNDPSDGTDCVTPFDKYLYDDDGEKYCRLMGEALDALDCIAGWDGASSDQMSTYAEKESRRIKGKY